jgi:integrase
MRNVRRAAGCLLAAGMAALTGCVVGPDFEQPAGLDVKHFMRTLGITTPAELPQADHKAVIAWERYMRETEHASASTIRRRLAALSSLYKHLVRHGHAGRNPVGEVERPAINRDEGTLAFSKPQARKVRRPRTRSQASATARSCPSACRSVCVALRSPR